MTWRSVAGGHQHRTPATLPKALHVQPGHNTSGQKAQYYNTSFITSSQVKWRIPQKREQWWHAAWWRKNSFGGVKWGVGKTFPYLHDLQVMKMTQVNANNMDAVDEFILLLVRLVRLKREKLRRNIAR